MTKGTETLFEDRAQIVRDWLTDGSSVSARRASVWKMAPPNVIDAFDWLVSEVDRLDAELRERKVWE